LYRSKEFIDFRNGISLASLSSHTLTNFKAKRNMGGGFQTRKESDTKMIEDVYSIRHKEKRMLEHIRIQNKIEELKNFNLGLSSNPSESRPV